MKNRSFVCLFLLFGLFLNACAVESIVIKGKIEGAIPEKISYNSPENGFFYTAFNEEVPVDKSGNFTITIDLKEPQFLGIVIPEMRFYRKTIIEPGETYHLLINTDEDKSFRLEGTSVAAQNIYDSFPDPEFMEMVVKRDMIELPSDKRKELFAGQKNADISRFRDLLDKEEISKPLFDLIKNDRDCYYASLEAMCFITTMRPFEDNAAQLEKLMDIYKEYPPTERRFLKSSFWKEYVNKYILVQCFLANPDFTKEKMEEMRESNKHITYNLDEAEKFLGGDFLEYYRAEYIYFSGFQKRYEKELIDSFNEFKADYPKSKYTKYIEPLIEEIVDYHKVAESSFSENMHFIPDYQSINTLEEAISHFKGKKLYIDVWATWCGPCKVEFKHNTALKKVLKEDNTEILYISIDDDYRDKDWQSMIKFYNLEGYHVRAGKGLDKDLRDIFGKDGMIAIPWYIQVNENGDIVEKHAKKPSELVKK